MLVVLLFLDDVVTVDLVLTDAIVQGFVVVVG